MTTFKKKKFITSAQQTKVIKEQAAATGIAKAIHERHYAEPAKTAEQVFEDSNKPDLEELGRQAKLAALETAAYANVPVASGQIQDAKQAAWLGAATSAMPALPRMDTLYREPKWLTTGEAAKHIKVSPTKFIKLRAEGIKFYKLNDGTILYNVHDLNDWVMGHVVV